MFVAKPQKLTQEDFQSCHDGSYEENDEDADNDDDED